MTLEIVESEDVLELRVLVHDTSVTLVLSIFEAFDECAFDIVRLLVSKNCGEVLEQLQDFVSPEILVSFSEHLVVNIGDLKWIGRHFMN